MALIETKRAEISAILGDIEALTANFRRIGVDVSDPGDREAFDIIARIERRLMAQSPKKETGMFTEQLGGGQVL